MEQISTNRSRAYPKVREKDVDIREMYSVLRVYSFIKAQWLSWLERRPVTAEVEGSSPFRVAYIIRCIFYLYGIIAQLGEHLPYKQGVTGSSPVGPIEICRYGSIGRAADL